ncbi:hypothetical protein ACFL5G_03745 [Candidatus Margulisiibacteriota bacterium]
MSEVNLEVSKVVIPQVNRQVISDPDIQITRKPNVESTLPITAPEVNTASVGDIIASVVSVPKNLDETSVSFKAGVISLQEQALSI